MTDAAAAAFVERFASVLVEGGVPRMPARVFAALLADDAGRLTAAELAERLQVSPAAVSGAVRYLTQVSLVSREREPGSRRDVYRLHDDQWYEAIVRREPLLRAGSARSREGVDAVGADTPAGRAAARDRGLLRVPPGRDAGAARALARTAFSLNAHLAPCVGRAGVVDSGEDRMTELQQYLAEEVAEDHADGIITRREAIRRLGLLGVGAATASSMLAAEAAAHGGGHGHGHGHGGGGHGHGHPEAATSTWAPVAARVDHVRGPARPAAGAPGRPATQPRGGVLVIHENRGLTDAHPQRRGALRRQRLLARWRSTCSPRRAAPARSRRGRGRRGAGRRSPTRSASTPT